MSHIRCLLEDAEHLCDEIVGRNKQAQNDREKYYLAAVAIQRWVRGHITRVHILKLHAAATRIQSYWRLVSSLFKTVVYINETYKSMCDQFYNKMATKIQAFWRGYRSRQTVLDFYLRKKKMNEVAKANKAMKAALQAYRQEQKKINDKLLEKEAMEWSIYILHKLHHLLRTKAQEGIYSIHNSSELSQIECLLKMMSHKKFIRSLNRAKRLYLVKLCCEILKDVGSPYRSYPDRKKDCDP